MVQDMQQVLNDQGLDSASDHAKDMQQLEVLDRDFPPESIDETNALSYIQPQEFDSELSKQNYLSQLQLVNPSPHGKVTAKASEVITKQINQIPKPDDLAFYHFNGVNLESINIQNRNCHAVDLSLGKHNKVKFRQADLSHATFALSLFQACEFSNAKLERTNLAKAKFKQCQFTDSQLVDNSASGAEFEKCVFKNCTFTNLSLSKGLFQNCQFEECAFDEGIISDSELIKNQFDKTSFVRTQFMTTDLVENKFQQGLWSQVSINNSPLVKCQFQHLALKECGVSGDNPTIENCLFEEVEANTNQLARLEISKVKIHGGKWAKNDFTYTHMRQCEWLESDAQSNSMVNLQLINCTFHKVNLSHCNMMGVEFKDSQLTQCQYKGVIRVHAKRSGASITS
jgi:uncharacterized protein YjbI with pentapeptide repeats